MVGGGEVDALGPGGMIEEPYFVERAGTGIGQVGLATFFEVVGGDLIRVGHNSVDDFESVAVGFVLKMAADGVERGGCQKCEHGNHEQQGGERGPVFEA